MNELTTDESNDVAFMEEPGPKSFKNLFSHEHRSSDAKETVPKETSSAAKDTDTDRDKDKDQEKDKQHKDLSSKSKNDGNGATKRTDWDMFAEQDIDSNFDVIKFGSTVTITITFRLFDHTFLIITEPIYNCRKQKYR